MNEYRIFFTRVEEIFVDVAADSDVEALAVFEELDPAGDLNYNVSSSTTNIDEIQEIIE